MDKAVRGRKGESMTLLPINVLGWEREREFERRERERTKWGGKRRGVCYDKL